jgi:homoserine dehydrogenase
VSPDFVSPYYVRFTVADRPGIIAALAAVFARHAINIDAILQQPGFPEGRRPFVVSLNAAPSSAIDRAIREMSTFDFHGLPPVALPLLATLVTAEDGRG